MLFEYFLLLSLTPKYLLIFVHFLFFIPTPLELIHLTIIFFILFPQRNFCIRCLYCVCTYLLRVAFFILLIIFYLLYCVFINQCVTFEFLFLFCIDDVLICRNVQKVEIFYLFDYIKICSYCIFYINHLCLERKNQKNYKIYIKSSKKKI